MSKISTVIFDMDGVLIDAREWHYIALNKVLATYGMEINRQDHLSVFDGLPTRAKLAILSARLGLPESSHEKINAMKQEETMILVEKYCKPVEEHLRVLSALKARNYKIAVASNSIKQSVESMLARAEILPFLNIYLSNEDVKKSKPNPEIYYKTMALLNVTPDECVIVEDNPHGVAAARASGAHVLVVKDPTEVTFTRIFDFIDKCDLRA